MVNPRPTLDDQQGKSTFDDCRGKRRSRSSTAQRRGLPEREAARACGRQHRGRHAQIRE
ncbi:hypothetical protein MMC07_009577, partial [Pseudocyphellaria aurata]|nr:hypothetical protein [Pseudocyphellaria aurata]